MCRHRLIIIIIILFLIYPIGYIDALEGRFYWLKPGAYVVYGLAASPLEPVPGAIPVGPNDYNIYIPNIFNKSAPVFTFDNVTLMWRILDVNDTYALVNYTFILHNVYYAKLHIVVIRGDFYADKWVLVSAILKIDLRTMYVYLVNGSFVGRWPFWVNTYDLYNGFENRTYYTILHNVLAHDPITPTDDLIYLNFTIYFVGSSEAATIFGVNPEDYGITTPIGYFISSRIRCAYPKFINVNDTLYISSNPGFGGYWDVVTHIMFAYQDNNYVDDILRFFHGDLYYAAFRFNGPLVIMDTNIDFKLSEFNNGGDGDTASPPGGEPISNVSISLPRVNRATYETGAGGYHGIPRPLRLALITICIILIGVAIYEREKRL